MPREGPCDRRSDRLRPDAPVQPALRVRGMNWRPFKTIKGLKRDLDRVEYSRRVAVEQAATASKLAARTIADYEIRSQRLSQMAEEFRLLSIQVHRQHLDNIVTVPISMTTHMLRTYYHDREFGHMLAYMLEKALHQAGELPA